MLNTKNRKKSKKQNRHVEKIGCCDASTLGLSRGHYVFIPNVKNGRCDVNTLTSFERNNSSYKLDKIDQMRTGNISFL